MSEQKCVCSRAPKGHPATVDLVVYGRDGSIVEQLSLPACDGVVESYQKAIAAGMMTASIRALPL